MFSYAGVAILLDRLSGHYVLHPLSELCGDFQELLLRQLGLLLVLVLHLPGRRQTDLEDGRLALQISDFIVARVDLQPVRVQLLVHVLDEEVFLGNLLVRLHPCRQRPPDISVRHRADCPI